MYFHSRHLRHLIRNEFITDKSKNKIL